MPRLTNRLLAVNALGLFVLAYALLFGHGYAAPSTSTMAATPLGTTFQYEGRLGSLTGTYDLKFRIFDAASGGTLMSPTTLAYASVVVDGGEYRVRMEFGANIFTGDQRFLEVSYRIHTTNASAPYSLQPGRQPLEAVPYALRAVTSNSAAYASQATSATYANYLGGYSASEYYRGYTGVQITQNTPLAAGGQTYYSTYGYNANETVLWSVKPTSDLAKLRLEVETEYHASDDTFTYYLRVYNTGTVAATYQVIRRIFHN